MRNVFPSVFLAFILVVVHHPLLAQQGDVTTFKDYSVIVVAQDDIQLKVEDKLKTSALATDFDFYYFNTHSSINSTKDSINNLLNQHYQINKTRLYLLLIGNTQWIDKHLELNNKIFADQYIISLDKNTSDIEHFTYQSWDKLDINEVLIAFKKKYLWANQMLEINKDAKRDISSEKQKRLGFLLGFNKLNAIHIKNDGFLPENYFDYGLSYLFDLKNRWTLNADLILSIKKPNHRNIAVSQFISQIDIIDFINTNGDTDQTVHLDMELVGRLGVQLNLDANYNFVKNKNISVYTGAGIGLSSLTSAKGSIDTIINVNIDHLNSLQEELEDQVDLKKTALFTPLLNVLIGYQHRLGKNTFFNIKAKYLFDLNSFSAKEYAHRFSIQTGLVFNINRKRKYYYKYF